MVNYVIQTANTAGLSSGLALVYGGKSGFTAELGVSELLCTGYTVGFNYITFNVSNLNLIYADYFSSNVIPDITTSTIKVPVTQFSPSSFAQGAVGYVDITSYASMLVQNVDVAANTITVTDPTVSNTRVATSIPAAPLRLKVFQPVSINNKVYVAPTHRNYTYYANVQNVLGTYVVPLRTKPLLRSDITVYLDDNLYSSFVWPVGSNSSQVSININTLSSNVNVTVLSTLPPAIEPKDVVSLPFYNNTYTVANSSYVLGSATYNASLLASNFFAIQLTKPLAVLYSGSTITNVSKDAEGVVSNLSATYFNFTSPNDYPYTYKLANSNLYYIYAKNDVRFSKADLTPEGKLQTINPGTYLVKATNINRANRTSPSITSLAVVEPIKLSKVSTISITEQIVIDTVGGATINGIINFPPILGRDVRSYEVRHRIVGPAGVIVKDYTSTSIPHSDTVDTISTTVFNMPRGAYSSSNILEVEVTPINGSYRGFPTKQTAPILGKQSKPSGLSNFNIAQQGDQVLFSWSFRLTSEGYILDQDTKEVEIREYPGVIDISNTDTLLAAWNLGLTVSRIPFPNKLFSLPISKYGTFTYLLRVRDTSNLESDDIGGSYVTTTRLDNIRLFKVYNEANAAINYAVQDNNIFPNSNTSPEPYFPSFSTTVNGGIVKAGSSNTDNSNGSAVGMSIYASSDTISSGLSSKATYITSIRDMGKVIKGTIRINPILSINAPAFTYASQYDIVMSGVSDTNNVATVLVDAAFGGIGTILGYANANAAVTTYDTFLKTLTSGGAYGNVYAIRNSNTQSSNQNSYALIAGVINANAIALGSSFYANGVPTGGNALANVTFGGNSFQLVNLVQFVDPRSAITFFGPNSTITENIYVRVSNSNVFYSAASNGVVGYPGHGNTNASAFYGASSNAELGWKNYIAGQLDFQYMQVRIDIFNKLPSQTEVLMTGLTVEVDVPKKSFSTVVPVTSASGTVVDYSYIGYLETPTISATTTNSSLSCSVAVYNANTSACTVKVFNSVTGAAVTTETINITAIGI